MNANNQLEVGETLLIMRSGSRGGKTITGTRVFKSWEDFREWAMNNMVDDRCNKPVGEVAWHHDNSVWDYSGPRPVMKGTKRQNYLVTQTGYELVGYYTYTLFSAFEDRDPKKIKLTLEMLGLPEGKWQAEVPK